MECIREADQENGFHHPPRISQGTENKSGEGEDAEFVAWKGKPRHSKKTGGTKAAAYIFVAQVFDVMALTAVQNNLIRYLYNDMHFSVAKSANVVTTFVGTANLLSLAGGFVSDSFLTRFRTMSIFSAVELTGYTLLTAQAYFPSLRPPKCVSMDSATPNTCEEAKGVETAVLLLALYLIALGSGFMKSNLLAHGADQFDQQNPEQTKKMFNFFNWAYFSVCLGSVIALTLLVGVQDNVGRFWGFAISAIAMFIAFISLLSGNFCYRNKIPSGSPLTRFLHVFVAAFRNRNKQLTEQEKTSGTRLRFLKKAAFRREGSTSDDWDYCSIEQVEETIAFLRILPIFGSTIVMNCAVAQLQTFSVQQGSLMDARLSPNFQVPPASMGAIPFVLFLFVVPLYDLFFVPFARNLTGHPAGLPTLKRTGLGLIFSATSMAVAAMVETKRRTSGSKLSILYLLPQFFLSSFAEFFTRVGLVEFFYSQSPPQMRSMSVALNSASVAMGYFLSSLLVSITNGATVHKDKNQHLTGWLSENDLNKDHLNYFYWLLCATSVINFIGYVFCAISYESSKHSDPSFENVVEDRSSDQA